MYAELGVGVLILAVTGTGKGMWIPILLASILLIAGMLAFRIFQTSAQWLAGIKVSKSKRNDALVEAIQTAGYSYDPKQDIFYSCMDAWQRNMGYCRLYDEAAATLNMIMDCEPIYFEYGGKRWLIEFWKGQYGMTTGGEIGVYTTEEADLDIPKFFNGTFYHCASNEDMLQMSYTLVKNGEKLFKRKDSHWWLAGYKLGEFSEPSELMMYLSIVLKDATMRNAFVEGLKKAGYSKDEILINRNTVSLVFYKTRTPQPASRVIEIERIIQRKNKLLCDKYQKITSPYDNFQDKINAIRKQAPEIYAAIFNIGKTKQLFEMHEKIKDYLS